MPKAIWKNAVLAESDHTEIVEGNHYFPPDSVHQSFFRKSEVKTVCGWKGTASYYDVLVDGEVNAQAAWFYPDPLAAANNIRGYIAFWKGVEVKD